MMLIFYAKRNWYRVVAIVKCRHAGSLFGLENNLNVNVVLMPLVCSVYFHLLLTNQDIGPRG